jgi:hypothetical protein
MQQTQLQTATLALPVSGGGPARMWCCQTTSGWLSTGLSCCHYLTGIFQSSVCCRSATLTSLESTEREKLLDVIDREFSLEILLKNQERKTIEAEKAKVEISMKQLEQCLAHGGTTASVRSLLTAEVVYSDSANRYHNYYNQYVDYGTRSSTHNGSLPPPTSARPQRTAAKAAARSNSTGNVCLARNEQGKLVRYVLPQHILQ